MFFDDVFRIRGRLEAACFLIFMAAWLLLLPSCGPDKFASRSQTMSTLERIKDDNGIYDAYYIDVKYDYDLDKVISECQRDDMSCLEAAYKDSTLDSGFLAVLLALYGQQNSNGMSFACSAFSKRMAAGDWIMGRNYDWGSSDSSMLLVHCKPKGGYESIGIACLSHIFDNEPLSGSVQTKVALMAPYCCIDGINEKGVSICTLMVNAGNLKQNAGKPVLYLPFLIRMVLDRAATTQQAVELISQYDVFGALQDLTTGTIIDYHFYISDASGDARVVEFDPDDPARATTATGSDCVTNFYVMDNNDPAGSDYGYGQDRYQALKNAFDNAPEATEDVGWTALHNAWQDSTIWSFMANNSTREFTVEYHKDSQHRLVFKDFKLVKQDEETEE